MNDALLDSALRRTGTRDRAFFEEVSRGPERAMRLIRIETLRALDANYAGRKAGGMGTAEIGEKIDLEGFSLAYDPARQGWAFDGEFYSVVIRDTCNPKHAAAWLRTFRQVEIEAPGLLAVAKPTHVVGVDGETRYVARKYGNTVAWFNHSSGFLMAAGLEEITRDTDKPMSLTRFIHHEAAHMLEPAMKDWMRTTTNYLESATPLKAMNTIAEQVNPQYLPARMSKWRKDRSKPGMAAEADEDMAAEFLVEAYAHAVIEKRPWPSGIWRDMDRVVAAMKAEVCHDRDGNLTRAHVPTAPNERISILPKTVEVSPELAARATIVR